MITPKRLVRGVFESADLPRLPFIPWVFTHTARLEQIPVRRIFTDATQYTKCLQNAQKLYGYDAIITSFGFRSESFRRINRGTGSNLALAAVINGPLTLIAGLTGKDPIKDFAERPGEAIGAIEAAAEFLLKVVQVYCQLELDVIVITEKLMSF